MPLPSKLAFTSLLQYSPRGAGAVSRKSKDFTHAVKIDGQYRLSSGNVSAIAYAAERLSAVRGHHPALVNCFCDEPMLVPVPRRTPVVAGGLWPTDRLCRAMEKYQVGYDVMPLLERIKPVQKSATAPSGQRPGPQDHYDSLAVAKNPPMFGPGHHFIIVDDVVTRGATFIGCYARLREAYPEATISCFALIRTMSNVDIDAILSPTAGTITFTNNSLHREP